MSFIMLVIIGITLASAEQSEEIVFLDMMENMQGLPVDWKPANVAHYCNWTGVHCFTEMATIIDLRRANLTGSVLFTFYGHGICYRRFWAAFRSSMMSEFDFFHRCLEPSFNKMLQLNENKLTGTLPESLFDGLILHLILNDNLLSGTLPKWVESDAQVFGTMALHNNLLSGCIPYSWKDVNCCDPAAGPCIGLGCSLYGNHFNCSEEGCMQYLPASIPTPCGGITYQCPPGQMGLTKATVNVIISALVIFGVYIIASIVYLFVQHRKQHQYQIIS